MARTARTGLMLASLFLLSMVTGCFPTYDYNSASNYGSKRDMPRQDTSRAYQTQQQYAPVSHKITKLEMNQTLSDQVAAMNGVYTAIVLMGDNTAYVGITMDNTATGTHGGDKYGPETSNYGIKRGYYNANNPLNDAGNPDDLVQGSAGGETEMHHEHLAHLFKQKIAEKIRSLQPTVLDVYISANRTLVNEFNRIAQESWHGRNLEPQIPGFIRLVEQVFGTDPTIPNQAEANGRESK